MKNYILWKKIEEVAILMNVTMTKTEELDSYIFSRHGVPHFNEGYNPPPCGDLREIYNVGRLCLYIDKKGQAWTGMHSVSMLDEGKLDAILTQYKSGEGSDIDDAILFINKDAKISEITKILSTLSDNNVRCVNFMASFSDYSYHRIARFFIKSKILDSPGLTIGKDSEIHFNGKKYSADDFKKNFIDSSNEQMDKKANDIMLVTLSFSTPDMTYGDVVGVFMLLGQATSLRVSFPEMSRN